MTGTTPCPVCGELNRDLAGKCRRCGAFLRERLAALDLFQTAWRVIESPGRSFLAIATAEHKTYTILLSMFGGGGLAFFYLSVSPAWETAGGIGGALLAGGIAGAAVGLVGVCLLALLLVLLGLAVKKKVSFSSARGVLSYALLPAVLNLILVLPMKVMAFGVYQFLRVPESAAPDPVLHWLALGIDSAFGLWLIILIACAVRALFSFRFYVSLVASVSLSLISTLCGGGTLRFALNILEGLGLP